MRGNRRNSVRREKVIMVTSSALVLAALTMTGLYMKGQELREQDNGYTLDFAAMEKNSEKAKEIGGGQTKKSGTGNGPAGNSATAKQPGAGLDNDLDYLPEEGVTAQVGSRLVEIPGLTGETSDAARNAAKPEPEAEASEDQPDGEDDAAGEEVVLHYSESQGLTRPVNGEILLPFSMDGSIYFATLDQYKYNPATMFSAKEGSDVFACATGKVTGVSEDAELGKVVTIDLGDGYTAVYGQLKSVKVKEDSYVKAGEKLAEVAAPSRYYSKEGTNLYFCLKKNGTPVNSENLY